MTNATATTLATADPPPDSKCLLPLFLLFQVSPDEAFEEILGVSDTFIPDANIWVGEYPYVDKVRGRTNR